MCSNIVYCIVLATNVGIHQLKCMFDSALRAEIAQLTHNSTDGHVIIVITGLGTWRTTCLVLICLRASLCGGKHM